MGNSIFFKVRLSVTSFILVLISSAAILASGINYATFFGPSLYSPGVTGTKNYKVNFSSPVGNALLLIKNGNGTDVILERCKGFQIACLLRNLFKEAEVFLLRPTSLTVSINNIMVLSKNDYDSKKGITQTAFVATKNNVMDIKIKGSFFPVL